MDHGPVLVLGALALAHLIVSRTHPSTPAWLLGSIPGCSAGMRGGTSPSPATATCRLGTRPSASSPRARCDAGTRPPAWRERRGRPVGRRQRLGAARHGPARRAGAQGDRRRHARPAHDLAPVPRPAGLRARDGYAEATLLLFVVACFLCIRPRGGQRPPGGGRPSSASPQGSPGRSAWSWCCRSPSRVAALGPVEHRQRLGSAVAVVAPLAGMAAFLVWSELAVSNFLLPLRVQTSAGLHGGLSDPATTSSTTPKGAPPPFRHRLARPVDPPRPGAGRARSAPLPGELRVFAAGVVLAALSGTNLDSFERYALSAFPLVMAASTLTGRREVERAVLALSRQAWSSTPCWRSSTSPCREQDLGAHLRPGASTTK